MQLPEQLTGHRLVVVGQGPSFEVLVVGGGLAGFSMAITLAREGVDVRGQMFQPDSPVEVGVGDDPGEFLLGKENVISND